MKDFILSILPVKYEAGQIKFTWSKFWLQAFSVLLYCGIAYKWFVLKEIESVEVISLAGYILGTGWLKNSATKIDSEIDKATQ